MLPTINQQVADRFNELEIPNDAFDSPMLKREFKLWQQGKRLMIVRQWFKSGVIVFTKVRNKVKG